MGYNFEMGGEFTFSKKLPKEVMDVFREMTKDIELGSDWYADKFKLKAIEEEGVCWCPWVLNEDEDALVTCDDVGELNHNYWFIDWICWIIEAFCIPNGIKMNGDGWWEDDYAMMNGDEDAEGNGRFTVKNNKITVHGVFFGSDGWKASVRHLNEVLKGTNKKKPDGVAKGSFCVTGKVSMTRDEFQKLGVEHGFEFKSSVSKGLTYLVCNDPNSTSTKIQKAKKDGIKVITEEEFKKILGI